MCLPVPHQSGVNRIALRVAFLRELSLVLFLCRFEPRGRLVDQFLLFTIFFGLPAGVRLGRPRRFAVASRLFA